MMVKYSVPEFLKRNANSWVRDSRLQEIDNNYLHIIDAMKSSGGIIESRFVKDGNGEATMYRLVIKRAGARGEWRCASCYTNVSAEFSESLTKTVAENIRQGYCPECKKKRVFQPA